MTGALQAGRLRLLLKNVAFTIVVPGTAAGIVPLVIARGRAVSSMPAMVAAGLVLLVTGGAVYAWCVWDFATFGRGTPLPIDAPRRLVTRGLYRFTRNPMYLGVLCAAAGWPAIFASIWLLLYAAVLALAFHLFVVLYEEPRLRVLFDAEYDAYCRTVPRWIPRPRPRTPG
jgi:protein-S-isoprenylcysteine O-methyltransferase Ste14